MKLRERYVYSVEVVEDVKQNHCRNDSGIEYDDYSGPASWQPPYAVLRASLASNSRKDFVAHAGEEIVLPINKSRVRFQFFWSGGSEKPKVINEDLNAGSVLRLNPDVPHNAWAIGQTQTEAWVIIRHANDSEAAVSVADNTGSATSNVLHRSATSLTKDKLQNPGRYALVAWGVAAKLKTYRERAGLKIKQVAEDCGINHTHLSRIENGETNISVETLIKLARHLRVDIGEFFRSKPWYGQIEDISGNGSQERHHLKCPNSRHFLHGSIRRIRRKQHNASLGVDHRNDDGVMISYIVLSGRAIAEFPGAAELLDQDAVMHLRAGKSVCVEALDEDLVLLEVIYSSFCGGPK